MNSTLHSNLETAGRDFIRIFESEISKYISEPFLQVLINEHRSKKRAIYPLCSLINLRFKRVISDQFSRATSKTYDFEDADIRSPSSFIPKDFLNSPRNSRVVLLFKELFEIINIQYESNELGTLDIFSDYIQRCLPNEVHRGWLDFDCEGPRFLMVCHDENLDRRVVQQAESLANKNGMKGIIICRTSSSNEVFETHDNFLIHRVRKEAWQIPDDPVYWEHLLIHRYINKLIEIIDLTLESSDIYKKQKITHLIEKIYLTLITSSITTDSPNIYDQNIRDKVENLNSLVWPYYVKQLNEAYDGTRVAYPLPFTIGMLAAASLYPADLIIGHDLTCLKPAYYLAKSLGVPLIYDSHEYYPEQESFSVKQKDLLHFEQSKYITQCDAVITVTPSIAAEMEKRYSISGVNTILNAVDPPVISDSANCQPATLPSLRKTLRIDDSKKIALFQGGMTYSRNIVALVDGFLKFHSGNKSLHLVLMGSIQDDLRQEILLKIAKHHAEEYLHLLKPVPQNVLLHYTSSADFGIIPYKEVDLNTKYCNPNKLFEYIQACLPIMANDLIEVKRILDLIGGGGMVWPLLDSAKVAAGFDAMLQRDLSKDRRLLQSKRAEFGWENESKKYMNIINSVCKKRGITTNVNP